MIEEPAIEEQIRYLKSPLLLLSFPPRVLELEEKLHDRRIGDLRDIQN